MEISVVARTNTTGRPDVPADDKIPAGCFVGIAGAVLVVGVGMFFFGLAAWIEHWSPMQPCSACNYTEPESQRRWDMYRENLDEFKSKEKTIPQFPVAVALTSVGLVVAVLSGITAFFILTEEKKKC
jgi:hypothetical protein